MGRQICAQTNHSPGIEWLLEETHSYVKDRRKAPSFRAGIRAVHVRSALPTFMPPGVGRYATQQGQNLAVGLGSARTTKATIPFPGGRLRGRRDGIAAAAKKQSSPGWSRPCGFDGREGPMARPVAHHPGRGWGPRTAVRWCGPLRADTQPATPCARGRRSVHEPAS